MRAFLIVGLGLMLAACSQSVRTTGADYTAVAGRNSIDLASADGAVFLQSAHTGFMEAVPMTVEAPQQPPPRRRGIFGGRQRSATSSPEIGNGRATGPIQVAYAGDQDRRSAPPAPATRRDLPHITVRPRQQRDTRSLREAFEAAYDTNPVVNQARANLRSADEDVAIARSGNRPTVTASVSQSITSERNVNFPFAGGSSTQTDDRLPTVLQLDVNQPLFQGFQTRNLTRQAEATVRAERERLRGTEQDVLLATAIAFTDIKRFRDGVRFRTNEVVFLREQVSAAGSRQEFGEGTRTDIDQARARLAESEAILAQEKAALASAEAEFERLTNMKAAGLRTDVNVVALLPASLSDALGRGASNSPDIRAAIHDADTAQFNVKALEGQALPSLSLNGQLATTIGDDVADRTEAAEVGLTLTIPIYQGGQVSAQVRQAKEQLGSARIGVDVARNDNRSEIMSAWGIIQTSRAAIRAAELSIAAAQRALDGVLEELRVGQRTTIDVLNAQQDLVRAEITKITAIRDRDTAAYNLLRAMGGLEVHMLGLNVEEYDPREHYSAVKGKWGGMRTPDGR